MINVVERQTNKLPGLSSLFVTFAYNPMIVEGIKSVPSAIFNKKDLEWEVPTCYLSKLIDALSQYDDIELELMEEEHQVDKVYEIGPYKTTPFSYQQDAIQYGLNHKNWLLLDAPGLGKSPQLIWLAEELKRQRGIKKVLIVCGINTLKNNWKKEIKVHSNLTCHILGERVNKKGITVVKGVQERLEDLKRPIDDFFVITNIETLRNEDIVKAINKQKFDMIIVDECHKANNPTAQQSKGLLKLEAEYKVGLTGTLLTNSPFNAYLPLKWLGVDNSTFTNYKFFYATYTGPFNNILLGYRNINTLKDQLATCSLRRTKDMLNLPEKTIIDEYVEMEDDQKKFYDDIKNGIIKDVDKVDMSATTVLSLVGRLRQATACPSILTSEKITASKIERACDLVEEITENGDKVVVFSVYKETLNVLYNKLGKYSPLLCTGDVKDEEVSKNIDAFQNNDTNMVMLATTAKMGTGVTLTRASYAIFIDTPFTYADYLQCQDRVHRVGTKKPVFIYNLICEGTVDEHVREIVEGKQSISDFVIDNKVNNIDSLRKYIQELN